MEPQTGREKGGGVGGGREGLRLRLCVCVCVCARVWMQGRGSDRVGVCNAILN